MAHHQPNIIERKTAMQIQNVDPETVSREDFIAIGDGRVFIDGDSIVVVFQDSAIKVLIADK